MAVPRAQLGGAFGSGVYPTAPHQIDVAGIINAAAGGASSLLQGAYLRKVAERNYANSQAMQRSAAAQRTFENTRQTTQDTLAAQRYAEEKQRADRDYNLRVEENRQKALAAGIDPVQQIVPPTTLPIANTPSQEPGIATLDQTAPPPAPRPAQPITPLRVPMAGISTPEQYNPAHDVGLQRSIKLRSIPVARPPVDLGAVKAEATARAQGTAAGRPAKTPAEDKQAGVSIRQAIQQARTAYMKDEKDQFNTVTKPGMSWADANKAALADVVEAWGEEPVRTAIGGKATKETPHPQTGLTDSQVSEAMASGAKSPADVRAYWKGKKR